VIETIEIGLRMSRVAAVFMVCASFIRGEMGSRTTPPLHTACSRSDMSRHRVTHR
jgi:hypothetical protein